MEIIYNIFQVAYFFMKWVLIMAFSSPFCYVVVPLIIIFVYNIISTRIKGRR